MGKRFELLLYQNSDTGGKRAQEKMFNIISY